jgi:hypothetical protein
VRGESPNRQSGKVEAPCTCDFQVALLIQEQVLGFEVAIDEVQRVHVLKYGCDLAGVEAGRHSVKLSCFP